MKLESFTKSDKGVVRKNNEDFSCEMELAHEHRIFLVADGMGGHQRGDVASKLAALTFCETYKKEFERHKDVIIALQNSFSKSNSVIVMEGEKDEEGRRMGSTLTVLIIKERDAFLGHVGDSRCYLIRNENILQLTEDHSLVSKMIRGGLLTPDQAHSHPKKNVLYQSLGIKEKFEPNFVGPIPLMHGDVFVLCTDGLYNMISDMEMLKFLENKSSQESVENMIQRAKERGAPDNVTVSVVKIIGEKTLLRKLQLKRVPSLIKNYKFISFLLLLLFAGSAFLIHTMKPRLEKSTNLNSLKISDAIEKVPAIKKESILLEKVNLKDNTVFLEASHVLVSKKGGLFIFYNGELFEFAKFSETLTPLKFTIRFRKNEAISFPPLITDKPFYFASINNSEEILNINALDGRNTTVLTVSKGKKDLFKYKKTGKEIKISDLNPKISIIFFDDIILILRDSSSIFSFKWWKESYVSFKERRISEKSKL